MTPTRPRDNSGYEATPGTAPAVQKVLDRLFDLHPKLMDLSLGRIQRLLAALGHPERKLPPVFHIAGTNGKGSTLAFMRSALEAAGYKVHCYTSPNLVRFNERIRLAGSLIGDDELIAMLRQVETANDGELITFFEITTGAAFLAFAENTADILLLETGLGGRLDTTNVIDAPAATAITTVDYDHQQFLGESLAEIAGEKAGIIKADTPLVLARQAEEADQVLHTRAQALAAPVTQAGRDWDYRADENGWQFTGRSGAIALPVPAMAGEHQIQNAALAIASMQAMGHFTVNEAQWRLAMTQTHWPGRLQRLHQGPLFDQLPDASEIWLDGGHNPSAGTVLAKTLTDWQAEDAKSRRWHLIVGMLASKEAHGFFAAFGALDPLIYTVDIPGESASIPAANLADAAGADGLTAQPAVDLLDAGRKIAEHGDGPARVLICGSLYLAGAVLRSHG